MQRQIRIPSNINTSFNGNNPVNNFAKYSASEVSQSPEVIWEIFNVNYTKYFWLTKNILNNYCVTFLVGDDIFTFFKKLWQKQSKFAFFETMFLVAKPKIYLKFFA